MKEDKEKRTAPGEIRDPKPGEVWNATGNWPFPDRSVAEAYADVLARLQK